MKKPVILLLILFVFTSGFCRDLDFKYPCVIVGTVKNSITGTLPNAVITVKNTPIYTLSDASGHYHLKLKAGKYTLICSMLGYMISEKAIVVKSPKTINDFFLTVDPKTKIKEVAVTGKTIIKQIKDSPYNVAAINLKQLHNNSLDLSQVLNKISGVKIRQTGGMGSQTSISLNGFSGNHVKIFMDGIPLDGSGNAMNIGKIPVDMADRIEVYKGVVPINLGADALGGAVNIITRNVHQSTLDASFSYGSFNTYKSNILFGETTKKGFKYQLNFYQNYSDNDYNIKTYLLQFNPGSTDGGGNYTDDKYWFKQFHATYHNEGIIAKVGICNKKWAKRLLVETTISQEHRDIQHANLIKIAYGGNATRSKNINPALFYAIDNLLVNKLNLTLSAKLNFTTQNNVDTLAREYNWAGNYIEKSTKGESSYSLAEYKNNSQYVTANFNYIINKLQFLSFNHVYSHFSRNTSDSATTAEDSSESDFMEKSSRKNVSGLSYNYKNKDKKWGLTVFLKYYNQYVVGPVDTSTDTSHEEYLLEHKNSDALGYGTGFTFSVLPQKLEIKTSYEKSNRLPTQRELFGDELLERSSAGLKPEKSNNINLNIIYQKRLQKIHAFSIEAGFIYRYTTDYIRRVIYEKYGDAVSVNWGKVKTTGVDLDINYSFKTHLTFSFAGTYQSIRNKEKYTSSGTPAIYYNDRLPNKPYLFGNTNLSYLFPHILKSHDHLIISYTIDYVHDFYKSWKSEGGKFIIPGHSSQNLLVNYQFNNPHFNVALSGSDLTNQMIFDNYNLQKPGRSFYIKLRYVFNK